jgi:hypothetical protein
MSVYWGDTMLVLSWPVVAGAAVLFMGVVAAVVCLVWAFIGRQGDS